MLSTLQLVLVFGLSSVLSLAVGAALLKLYAKWTRLPPLTFRRAVLSVLLVSVVSLVLMLGAAAVASQFPGRDREISLLFLAVLVIAQCWCLQRMLKASGLITVGAFLVLLLLAPLNSAMASFVIRPYLVEAFVLPTNAMAPTLFGKHFRAQCPRCGGVMIVPESARGMGMEGDLGICSHCWKTAKVQFDETRQYSGDRLIVMKNFALRRWDLVGFRHPEDPDVVYVSRLVGLPNERVEIRDGDVWINGARAERPVEISGLVYVADPSDEEAKSWGPAELGPDEMIVLGDFSERSKDSRMWEDGAPGHPPYAVPKSHIVGVVTHIYWPASRWQIVR